MRSHEMFGVVLLGLVGVLTGCAEVPTAAFPDRSNDAEDEDDEDESESRAALGVVGSTTGKERSSPSSANTTPTATALLTVTFKGSGNSDDNKRGRSCSDNAAKRSQAAFIDASEIVLVPMQDSAVAIAKVGAVASSGPSIDALKQDFARRAAISFAVPLDKVPATTTYAIIGIGQGFGSPSAPACGGIAMTSPDAEQFPRGCGVLGYIDARFDPATKSFVAQAKSQFLWGSNPKQKESSYYTAPTAGCDFYDSPLVLDLGGRGVTLGAPVDGVFDVDGDGHADRLPWVTSKDTPFLVRDANMNGVVDGIDELFGNRTRSPLGTTAGANGFAALAVWDADENGVIDARDPVWSTLRLWFDDNQDGKTDPGELMTLESRGVRSLAVGYVDVDVELSYGERSVGAIRQRSAATTTDGRAIPLLDVWFRRDL